MLVVFGCWLGMVIHACVIKVPLLVELVSQYPTKLGAGSFSLVMCCQQLNLFYTTMQDYGRQMGEEGYRTLESSMSRFLTHWKAWGGHCVFKHHMAWHLAQRARRHGNPQYYWTYADEGENRVMATVAKALSGSKTFYRTFLQRVLPEV